MNTPDKRRPKNGTGDCRSNRSKSTGRTQRLKSIGFDGMGAHAEEVIAMIREAQADPSRFTFNQGVNVIVDTALRLLREGRLKPTDFSTLVDRSSRISRR